MMWYYAERAMAWVVIMTILVGLVLPAVVVAIKLLVWVIGALWGAALGPLPPWEACT